MRFVGSSNDTGLVLVYPLTLVLVYFFESSIVYVISTSVSLVVVFVLAMRLVALSL